LFSVIIPLYNKAAYVEKAIQLVLAQTCQEFELIVVNDGSSDNSLEVVRDCPKLSIVNCQLIDQPNLGVSTARNNGVKVAKYDYIAFLDADDWWEPTYLEEMKTLIAGFPEAGIYGCGYYKVKNERYIRANIGVEPGFDRGLINYCRVYAKTMYMPLWTGATVVKKTVFESENGFKPALKLGEDFDLWIRIAMKYPVAFLNKYLANYNQDVELKYRAIGEKLYEPNEHMLFTDYGELMQNLDFRYLYERLAMYGLLPYYLSGKNKKEVNLILSDVHWKSHAFKYRLYYRILPKGLVQLWMKAMKLGSGLKKVLAT
jgi:glycosyltransferase involved in cell wall biosynthesis